MVRIVIADDHAIVRDGLKKLLSEEPDIQVVGEAMNGHNAVAVSKELQPDLVLMDIAMPILNGLEAAKKISESNPNIKIILLTQSDLEEHFWNGLAVGVSGYILKESAASELIFAIRAVSEGKAYLSPSMTQSLIREHRKQDLKPDDLTAREQEVFKLLAEGCTNQMIAGKLFISLKTVQTHRAHVMEKLNLSSPTDLVRYAIRKGIISV